MPAPCCGSRKLDPGVGADEVGTPVRLAPPVSSALCARRAGSTIVCMSLPPDDTPELLEPIDTDGPQLTELGDHPDEVDAEEAERGHRMWLAVDDLDDQSNGLG